MADTDRQELLHSLLEKQAELMHKIPHEHKIKDQQQGIVVAALGLIEETLEYLNTIGFKSWRPHPLSQERQLEELTDILFFYLELIILSGFSIDDIVAQYLKKHDINLKRYEAAKNGDYSWDKRATERGL